MWRPTLRAPGSGTKELWNSDLTLQRSGSLISKINKIAACDCSGRKRFAWIIPPLADRSTTGAWAKTANYFPDYMEPFLVGDGDPM